jgi:hypothetical protein
VTRHVYTLECVAVSFYMVGCAKPQVLVQLQASFVVNSSMLSLA